MEQLDIFRRGQQCRHKRNRDVDGHSKRFYYCSERGCSYALCAFIPIVEEGEEGEGLVQGVYSKSAHTHPVRPIRKRDHRALPGEIQDGAMVEGVENENREIVEGGWALLCCLDSP